MAFSNKIYNVLKWIALYLLPAMGTLYFALAGVWGFPYGEQVVGTISAIDAFLGVILGISTKNYNGDGTLNIDTSDPEKDIYKLELNVPVEELSGMKSVTFKVANKEGK